MGKRITLSELRECLTTIIERDEELINATKDNQNPQVIQQRTSSKARQTMAQDVLDALNGDAMMIRYLARDRI